MSVSLAVQVGSDASSAPKVSWRAADAGGFADLIVAKLLGGEEHAAELTARMSIESGCPLTDIYEALRQGIYAPNTTSTHRAALQVAELDQRLCRLAARLTAAVRQHREPEAVVLYTHRQGVSAALFHLLHESDVRSICLDFAAFVRYSRNNCDAISRQLKAVRLLFIDAASASSPEIHGLLTAINQSGVLEGSCEVILLADNPLSVDAANSWSRTGATTVVSLEASMAAAGLDVQNPLTAREQEVLTLIANGATNQQVARSLGISIATVKTYMERAQTKLNSVDRASTVAVAIRRGWM